MMEHEETSMFRSPIEAGNQRNADVRISSLSLLDLNEHIWDDCDSEISILSNVVTPETDDGHNDFSNDGFIQLETYLDGDFDNDNYDKQLKDTFQLEATPMENTRQSDLSTRRQHNFITQDMFEFKGAHAMSKNAIAARENRIKKKKYVENLERSFETINKENTDLKSKVESYESTITRLNAEVAYLKNVLANQSTLSALLQNIKGTPGVKFKTSITTLCSDISARRSGTNKNSNLDDNRENICNTLRRSKRKCAANHESEKKVRKVISGSVVTSESCHDATSLDDLIPEPEQASSTNTSISCVDKYTGQMDRSRIVSNHKLNGGVCLHVTGETVSIEFCQQCSKNSQSELAYNDHSYFRSSHDN